MQNALACVPNMCRVRFEAAFLVRFLGRRGSNESLWRAFVVAGEHDMDVFELRMWLVLRSVEGKRLQAFLRSW